MWAIIQKKDLNPGEYFISIISYSFNFAQNIRLLSTLTFQIDAKNNAQKSMHVSLHRQWLYYYNDGWAENYFQNQIRSIMRSCNSSRTCVTFTPGFILPTNPNRRTVRSLERDAKVKCSNVLQGQMRLEVNRNSPSEPEVVCASVKTELRDVERRREGRESDF